MVALIVLVLLYNISMSDRVSDGGANKCPYP